MYEYSLRINCCMAECFSEKTRWFSIEHVCIEWNVKRFEQSWTLGIALEKTTYLCLLPAAISKCRADVVFIMDSSISVTLLNWFILKQFVMDIIRGFRIGRSKIRVGVVHYSSIVVTDFHLRQYYNAGKLMEEVWKIPYLAEATNTVEGIEVTALCCSGLLG